MCFAEGDDLFAAVNGSTITYSPQDQYLRIPCGVSHPKATATLCKRDKSVRLFISLKVDCEATCVAQIF